MANKFNQLPAFDLPINEVTGYVDDLMAQIGENVMIDGVSSKVMIADLERVYSNMHQNMKRTVFLLNTKVRRGSKVEFEDGKTAIVYTEPNNDIVSKSAEILLCNSQISFYKYGEVYDTDPTSPSYGDIVSKGLNLKGEYFGFIERLTAKEKQFDVGLLHDAILRFVTFRNSDIELDDIAIYKNKKYRVIDVDDITEGILVIQLANVRS